MPRLQRGIPRTGQVDAALPGVQGMIAAPMLRRVSALAPALPGHGHRLDPAAVHEAVRLGWACDKIAYVLNRPLAEIEEIARRRA